MEENYNNTEVNMPNNNVQSNNTQMEEPISIGDWVVSLIVMMIPCVNIIMMFVWAFGEGKKSKQNFFKAYLIITAVSIVLGVILAAAIGTALTEAIREIGNGMY